MQNGPDPDADKTGPRLGSDRDQQGGEDQCISEQLDAPVGRENGSVMREPEDQRNDADGDRRDYRSFIEAAVIVNQQH